MTNTYAGDVLSTDIEASFLAWCNQSLPVNLNCAGNSTGNHTSLENDLTFILPLWRQLLWDVLFGGMVVVATGGNIVVVWIVLTTKRMRTVTNYFLVNLSIADAMVSSLNVTFNYIYMKDSDWRFGELYCKISQFIATLSISASVFTLMAISIDRYVAIMKPLQPRMSKCLNLSIGAAIWITSIIIASPMFLFFTTTEIPSRDGIRTICFAEWPDGLTDQSDMENIYNILFMILTYILPIISMTVTYARVGCELWGSQTIGEYMPRQVENIRSKRRVVKMMIVVVLIFGVCWLPFHAWFILTSWFPSITKLPFTQDVFLLIYWLAMSNSMYNPIIYCCMNSRFRHGFEHCFRWFPFVNVSSDSGSPQKNRINRNDTQRSLLYTCSGSPKSRRISHCGVLRNSKSISERAFALNSTRTVDGVSGRDLGGIGLSRVGANGAGNRKNSYHQRCISKPNSASSYELAARRGKDCVKMTRTEWPSYADKVTGTATTTSFSISAASVGNRAPSEHNSILDNGRTTATTEQPPTPPPTPASTQTQTPQLTPPQRTPAASHPNVEYRRDLLRTNAKNH